MSVARPRYVGPYALLALLGRGGQGEVWRARGPDGQEVAVKLLLHRTPELVLRAWREARLQGTARSPHVVEVLESFVHEDVPVLVMEYVEGQSLRDLARKRQLDFAEIDAIVEGVFEALHTIHKLGMVHRDLKPANVLITEGPSGLLAKLTDFGTAREQARWDRGAGLTGHNVVLGTPGFIAPEQVFGDTAIDERVDIFALGALLYQLVTGQRPYRGPTPMAVIGQSLKERRVPISELRPETPQAWMDAIAWALCADLEQRAPSIAALRQVWRGSRAVPSREAGTGTQGLLHRDSESSTEPLTVGRGKELRHLARLLGKHRLITLRGPPGMGKSHLAMQVARSVGGDAVRVAHLGEVPDERGLLAALAHGLGMSLANKDPRTHVLRKLQTARELLLVIDNAEHLVQPLASLMSETFESAGPDLRILVSSRRALGVEGEQVVRLGPMASDEAAQLFEQRARKARPGFDPSAHVAEIAEIVQLVGGNPLALILAAARTDETSPAGLVVQLAEHKEGRRDAMDAALEWSWKLLDRWERLVLAQCSIFRDGFTFEAAAAVVQLPEQAGVPSLGAVLTSLHAHSLVVVRDKREGFRRLALPEVIRRYGAARLAEDPDLMCESDSLGELRTRHARWYARFGETGLVHWRFTESGMHDVLLLRAERANLTAAFEHAMDEELVREVGLLGRAYGEVMAAEGPLLDAAARLGEALVLDLEPVARVHLTYQQANLLHKAGRSEPARRQVRRALRLAESLGNGIQNASMVLDGNMDSLKGDMEAAREKAERVLAQGIPAEPSWVYLRALALLGITYNQEGDLASAAEVFSRAVELARQWELVFEEASLMVHYAASVYSRFGGERALPVYKQALECGYRTGRKDVQGRMHTNIALVYDQLGDREAAIEHLEKALSICRDTGNVYDEGIAEGNLGGILFRAGRYEEAEPRVRRGIALASTSWPVAAAAFRGTLALLMNARGQHEEALAILDALEAEVRDVHAEIWFQLLWHRSCIRLDHGMHLAAIQGFEEVVARANHPGLVARLDSLYSDASPEVRSLVDQIRMRTGETERPTGDTERPTR